jgi:hypothetical protein
MKVWRKRDPDLPADAVYVGRPTKWGNPYFIDVDGSREEIIEKYRIYLETSDLREDLHELKGKDLVCWCAPLPCHADVLLELANQESTVREGSVDK